MGTEQSKAPACSGLFYARKGLRVVPEVLRLVGFAAAHVGLSYAALSANYLFTDSTTPMMRPDQAAGSSLTLFADIRADEMEMMAAAELNERQMPRNSEAPGMADPPHAQRLQAPTSRWRGRSLKRLAPACADAAAVNCDSKMNWPNAKNRYCFCSSERPSEVASAAVPVRPRRT
jgi:hypothetical protein